MATRRLTIAVTTVVVGCLLLSTAPATAQPQAICVDWQTANPNIPHYAYSGATTRLKGIARGEAVDYRWDYGDGSAPMAWTAISNRYALEATHVYSGVVGQTFVATLHVRNGVGDEHSDTYRVRLFESSDLSDPDQLDVRINMAIDEGLWWLHKRMIRNTYPGGAPGYGQPYGYWAESYHVVSTAVGVDAFQLHGSKANGDYDGDPYVETVQRGLNYLLANTHAYNIGPQPAGDPDTNGNGIGLVINHTGVFNDHRQTYIGGISMVTLASSGAPNLVAAVGGTQVVGRTYAAIVQDMVDFFAYGQVEVGTGRGGWRYYANYNGSDMSTTQWPALGMMAAEAHMGATVPQFVRDELWFFVEHTRYTACNNDNGGFGYSTESNYLNDTKAAAGIICHEFLHTPLNDPRIAGAMGFLYRHWNDTGGSWTYQRLLGNSYGMYGVMKAMRLPGELAAYGPYNPTDGVTEITNYDCTIPGPTADEFDWYYSTNAEPREGLGHYIVRTQQSDGSWDDVPGPNPVYNEFATAWRVLILLRVFVIPPQAVICHCNELSADWNQAVDLDGNCSFHPVEGRNIVLYQWDFDCDGTIDAEGETAVWPGKPDTGQYCVALRVADDNPEGTLQDTQECEVWVHEPPHVPIADANGPYIGFVGMPTTLDACASWDPNDDIESYAWDLDQDGVFDDCVSLDPECTCDWACPDPGEWGICVEVCDRGEGGFEPTCDTDCTTIDCDNHRPVSDPNGPYQGPPNSTITLDGSGSYDPDPGDAITYAWDLDKDGEFDDCVAASCPFTIGPDPDMVYDVCLRVTDSYGEYDIECATVSVAICPIDPEPLSQGYWHRQCLGVPESVGGIDPGREGRGPQEPTEPGFVDELMPCAFERLEDVDLFGLGACDFMDADPPSDPCQRAQKQLTALILNGCSERIMDGCPVELSAQGCSALTVGDAIEEIAWLIFTGECDLAADCAAAVNEGEGLVEPAEATARSAPSGTDRHERGRMLDRVRTLRQPTKRRR